MIVELARGPLETLRGTWQHVVYWDGMQQAIAMIYGDVRGEESLPCRVHSSCITAHVFLSTECDCREQLDITMKYMQQNGKGLIVWLDHEGRANGMMAHIASQQLKRDGLSQSEAYEKLGFPRDARQYRTAAEILNAEGVESVVIMTNNPLKIEALRDAGLPIVSGDKRVMIEPNNELLRRQYADKKNVDQHFIEGV